MRCEWQTEVVRCCTDRFDLLIRMRNSIEEMLFSRCSLRYDVNARSRNGFSRRANNTLTGDWLHWNDERAPHRLEDEPDRQILIRSDEWLSSFLGLIQSICSFQWSSGFVCCGEQIERKIYSYSNYWRINVDVRLCLDAITPMLLMISACLFWTRNREKPKRKKNGLLFALSVSPFLDTSEKRRSEKRKSRSRRRRAFFDLTLTLVVLGMNNAWENLSIRAKAGWFGMETILAAILLANSIRSRWTSRRLVFSITVSLLHLHGTPRWL